MKFSFQIRNELSQKWAFWDSIFIAAILIITFLVQWWLIKPPAHSDQLSYFISAFRYPDVLPGLGQNRLGMMLPVAFFISLFGYSEAAYYALPFLSLLFLVFCVYLLTWNFFGSGVALLSSWLVFGNSLVLEESSYLLPDVPSAALYTFSLVLISLGNKTNFIKSRSYQNLLFFCSGLFLGFTYLVRENAVLLFLFIIPFIGMDRTFWRKILFIGTGAFIVLLAELTWFHYLFNNPLARFSGNFTKHMGKPLSAVKAFLETDYLNIILQIPRFFLSMEYGWLFLFLFILFMVGTPLYLIRNMNKGLMAFYFWGLGFWFIYTMFGLSPVLFDAVFLRLHKFRYWFPIMIPLVTVGTFMAIEGLSKLISLTRILNGKLWATLGVAFIIILMSYFDLKSISFEKRFSRNGANNYDQFRNYLISNGKEDSVIWVDHELLKSISYIGIIKMYLNDFWGNKIWDGKIKSYIEKKDSSFFKEARINEGLMLYDNFLMLTRSKINDKLATEFTYPDYSIRPPDDWENVFISSNNDLAVFSVDDKPFLSKQKISVNNYRVKTSDNEQSTRIRYDSLHNELIISLKKDEPISIGTKITALEYSGDSYNIAEPVREFIKVAMQLDADPVEAIENTRLIISFIDDANNKFYREAKHSGLRDSSGNLNFLCKPPDVACGRIQFQIKINGPGTFKFGDMILSIQYGNNIEILE